MNIQTYRINDMQSKIKMPPIDIMLVGVTGAGKSSTINALLGSDAAKIGFGVNPETKDVRSFNLNQFVRLWDTPGLGDSPEEDAEHLKKIASYLDCSFTKDGLQCGKLIDIVLVIIDGSRRDLGEIYPLLNNTIFPRIESRNVLFVINQADQAMKGRHWNGDTSSPDRTLEDFLKEQAQSVQRRIAENTGQKILLPLCYSATNGFNIYSMIDYIWKNMPPQRKIQMATSHNTDDYDSDDDIGARIGEIVAAPIIGLSNFIDWLTLNI